MHSPHAHSVINNCLGIIIVNDAKSLSGTVSFFSLQLFNQTGSVVKKVSKHVAST